MPLLSLFLPAKFIDQPGSETMEGSNFSMVALQLWVRGRSPGWEILFHPMVSGCHSPSVVTGNIPRPAFDEHERVRDSPYMHETDRPRKLQDATRLLIFRHGSRLAHSSQKVHAREWSLCLCYHQFMYNEPLKSKENSRLRWHGLKPAFRGSTGYSLNDRFNPASYPCPLDQARAAAPALRPPPHPSPQDPARSLPPPSTVRFLQPYAQK